MVLKSENASLRIDEKLVNTVSISRLLRSCSLRGLEASRLLSSVAAATFRNVNAAGVQGMLISGTKVTLTATIVSSGVHREV